MNRKIYWFSLLLAIVVISIASFQFRSIAEEVPSFESANANVILIGIDTLRSDFLSTYGFPAPISPAIDQIGLEGVVFTDVVATSPWTLPSFASVLTGLYPSEHGAGTRTGAQRTGGGEPPKMPLPAEVPLLQEILVEKGGFTTALFFDNPYLSTPWGLTRGFDFVSRSHEGGLRSVQGALGWMAQHSGQRMFVFLHLMEPHLPYKPPEPFKTQAAQWIESEQLQAGAGEVADRRASLEALYAGEVAYTDHLVGVFTKGLQDLGLFENSIIIVTSDHGEEFLEHVETERSFYDDPRKIWGIGHGHTQYQELISVPLIIRFPNGRMKGEKVSSMVQIHDLAPSILEWVGIDVPEEMTGVSLSGALRGDPIRTFAFSEYILYGADRSSYREGRWKLILGRDDRHPELYDLSRDPDETLNLWSEHKKVARSLTKKLRSFEAAAAARGPGLDRDDVEIDDETLEELRALGYVQ